MTDILRWKSVKTRAPHKCFGCSNEYPAGTVMTAAAYADGGSVYSCYWCNVCVEYMQRYFHGDDGTCEGEIPKNDPEGWLEIKEELNAAAEREGSGE